LCKSLKIARKKSQKKGITLTLKNLLEKMVFLIHMIYAELLLRYIELSKELFGKIWIEILVNI